VTCASMSSSVGTGESTLRPVGRACLIGLLLLAFALRLYHLDAQSIWVDEGISLHLAISTWAEIVANRAANIHPPLYFFLLKGWVALAGTSVFSGRFPSALISLLQVASVYAIARRWLARATAWLAAFLTALSPVSVIYGQEIRAYALLPLVYLALLGITLELVRRPAARRRALWVSLGIVEVVGLHLHYVVLTAVVYVGGWSLLALWRGRRWADLRRWWITQLLVVLASLPWLITVLTRWSDVRARLEIGGGLTETIPVDYLLSQVGVFHLTGLAGAVGQPTMRLLAGLTFFLLIALLFLRLLQPGIRRTLARLVAHWLLPLSLALAIWRLRSFSHPRYTALYAPGLTLLAVAAVCPGQASRPSTSSGLLRAVRGLLSVALAVSVVLISLLGLRAYFFDLAFAKDDVEGVALYLEEMAEPDDLILIPEGDWSLTFAYEGEAPVEMPRLAAEEETWADLACWTAHRRRVFVMDYRREVRDWRPAVFFALESAGARVSRRDLRGLSVFLYKLDHPVEAPALATVGARFDPIALTQTWVEAETPADTALTLALRWRLQGTTDRRYGLAIRLLDVDGWPLATRNVLLLDGQVRPTDRWTADQEATTYHVLPIPPGTPPLTYTLTVGLYAEAEGGPRPLNLLDAQGAPRGQWLELSAVRLAAPQGVEDDPYRTGGGPPSLPRPVALATGLRLLGAALDRSALAPGQSLFTTLRWQATRAPLPDLRPRLALVQSGRELDAVASAPALGRYPTDRWQAGETVVEHRRLVIPPTAVDGSAEVVLTLGDQRLVLGQVEIHAGERAFSPPPTARPSDVRFDQVARLVGYDLPSWPSGSVLAGEPITLTLYWEALEGAANADYSVFTHVLASDGHLVGQHDARPASGDRPTAGWVPGEVVADRHVMTFIEPYTGLARIEVGLYDPDTMERVPVEGGETFVFLPVELTIVER